MSTSVGGDHTTPGKEQPESIRGPILEIHTGLDIVCFHQPNSGVVRQSTPKGVASGEEKISPEGSSCSKQQSRKTSCERRKN